MEFDHLCMGCMADREGRDVCPRCGYVEGTRPEVPFHLPPRTVLNGRYLLGKVLGHGGFGITYLAWDMRLNVKLAIKEYMPHDFASRTAGEREVQAYSGTVHEQFGYGLQKFLEEARILAQFNNHPGIVSVLDFFEENGTAYLVMSYIEGVTLEAYLKKRGGSIPFEDALKIMTPVMDALREVHGAGLLHRDVSPDNIYITLSRHVKLLDFGAARHTTGEQSRSLTVILKPGYAPPEQYYGRGRQGPWTDIYATAATIYRAVTGRTPPESMERMNGDDIKTPSKHGVSLPHAAEAALMRALSLKPEERYMTMREFQDAISGNAGEMNPEAPLKEAGTGGKPGSSLPPAGKTAKPRGASALLILALVIIGGLLLYKYTVAPGGSLWPNVHFTGGQQVDDTAYNTNNANNASDAAGTSVAVSGEGAANSAPASAAKSGAKDNSAGSGNNNAKQTPPAEKRPAGSDTKAGNTPSTAQNKGQETTAGQQTGQQTAAGQQATQPQKQTSPQPSVQAQSSPAAPQTGGSASTPPGPQSVAAKIKIAKLEDGWASVEIVNGGEKGNVTVVAKGLDSNGGLVDFNTITFRDVPKNGAATDKCYLSYYPSKLEAYIIQNYGNGVKIQEQTLVDGWAKVLVVNGGERKSVNVVAKGSDKDGTTVDFNTVTFRDVPENGVAVDKCYLSYYPSTLKTYIIQDYGSGAEIREQVLVDGWAKILAVNGGEKKSVSVVAKGSDKGGALVDFNTITFRDVPENGVAIDKCYLSYYPSKLEAYIIQDYGSGAKIREQVLVDGWAKILVVNGGEKKSVSVVAKGSDKGGELVDFNTIAFRNVPENGVAIDKCYLSYYPSKLKTYIIQDYGSGAEIQEQVLVDGWAKILVVNGGGRRSFDVTVKGFDSDGNVVDTKTISFKDVAGNSTAIDKCYLNNFPAGLKTSL